jgi:hypothetical protein
MKQKIYAPVTDFERVTSYCPLYLAWRILDGARDYFRTPIPEAFADKLAHRAEAVFARHPSWSRKATPRDGQLQFQSQRQREFILMFMRHWLAGSLSSIAAHCEGRMLAREHPAPFRDLPESFKVGQPLPAHSRTRLRHPLPSDGRGTSPHPGPLPRAERENHRQRFVHGCELLAV